MTGSVPASSSATNTTETALPAAPPRREGLRGNKYAYSKDRAPIRVVPRQAVGVHSQNNADGSTSCDQEGKYLFYHYSTTHATNCHPLSDPDSDYDTYKANCPPRTRGPRITIVSRPTTLVAPSTSQASYDDKVTCGDSDASTVIEEGEPGSDDESDKEDAMEPDAIEPDAIEPESNSNQGDTTVASTSHSSCKSCRIILSLSCLTLMLRVFAPSYRIWPCLICSPPPLPMSTTLAPKNTNL